MRSGKFQQFLIWRPESRTCYASADSSEANSIAGWGQSTSGDFSKGSRARETPGNFSVGNSKGSRARTTPGGFPVGNSKGSRARETSRDFSIGSWTRSAPGEFSLRAIVEWRSCSRSTLSLSARARSRSFAARFFYSRTLILDRKVEPSRFQPPVPVGFKFLFGSERFEFRDRFVCQKI